MCQLTVYSDGEGWRASIFFKDLNMQLHTFTSQCCSFSGADSPDQPPGDEYTEGLSHRGVGQAGDGRGLADNGLRDRTS